MVDIWLLYGIIFVMGLYHFYSGFYDGYKWFFLSLLGGDWNHGILNDFPETVANVIIPTDEVHDFSEG